VIQRGLFDPAPPAQAVPAPPAQRHSATSRDAAERIAPRAGTLRQAVLGALLAAPAGMTDEELQDALSMPPSTQRPRRIELTRAGLVRDSGRTRATKSGRRAVVWVAA
jgi:hypothetical protein